MSKASMLLQDYNPDSLATQISDKYIEWNTGRKGHRDELREVRQYVYATDTTQTTNRQNPWSHKTHIPKLCQIHDNLGTQYANALVGREDFFTFEPGDRDSATKKKRKTVARYLRTKHKYSKFRQAIKELLNDWVQTGNCFGQLVYVRETVADPKNPAGRAVSYEGPKLERIDPDDIEFDYTARSFAEAPKIVRQLVNIGEFIRESEERPELRYDPSVVNKVKAMRGKTREMRDVQINKMDMRKMAGFSDFATYLSSGKVELLHFYGDIFDVKTGAMYRDRMITVVDRRFVLRNNESTDFTHVGQLYHCGWRKRPGMLWAQGPLNKLVGMQYRIDHLENGKADALDQFLSPDEVYVGQVNTVEEGAIRKHYIDDGNGSVSYLRPDTSVLANNGEIAMLADLMEQYAGAPREAMGLRTPGEKTAFEFDGLMNAAGRLFQNKIDDFEDEFVEPILNGELELGVRNLNTSDIIEMQDDDFGVQEFKSITATDITVRGKLTPQGASHYAKRAQAVRELQQFSGELRGDPSLAVHFPAKARAAAWVDLLDLERFNLYSEFGSVAEQVELAQFQKAAQQVIEQNAAAADTQADVASNPEAVANG